MLLKYDQIHTVWTWWMQNRASPVTSQVLFADVVPKKFPVQVGTLRAKRFGMVGRSLLRSLHASSFWIRLEMPKTTWDAQTGTQQECLSSVNSSVLSMVILCLCLDEFGWEKSCWFPSIDGIRRAHFRKIWRGESCRRLGRLVLMNIVNLKTKVHQVVHAWEPWKLLPLLQSAPKSGSRKQLLGTELLLSAQREDRSGVEALHLSVLGKAFGSKENDLQRHHPLDIYWKIH